MPTQTKPKIVPLAKEKRKRTVKVSSKTASAKKEEKSSSIQKKAPGVKIQIVDIKGNKGETLALPEKMFGIPYNSTLVSQYVRIYRANQREGTASTKTRGLVEGSTRKIYKQKGTGKARHGSIRAPIFVGGGIVFGPLPRDFSMKYTKKMKKQALFSVFSEMVRENRLIVCEHMEKVEFKTKAFAHLLMTLDVKNPTLVITGEETKDLLRIARNIERVTVVPYHAVNPYQVLTHKTILFAKDAMLSYIKKT